MRCAIIKDIITVAARVGVLQLNAPFTVWRSRCTAETVSAAMAI